MTERFLEDLKNPPRGYTPIPFWFLNDGPDEEEIRRQMADFVNKGVEGIVIHPRIGIPREIPYFSEPYFEMVKYVVRTAAQLGMKVVLYDEGMYPSGSAHGLVAAENEDFASRGITLSDSDEGGQVITRFPDGKYLIYGFTHGTIRGIHYGEDDGEAGAPRSADILNPDAVDAFIRLTHDRYYRELGEYFGNTVIAFFTDEPCPLGRNAGAFREWAPGMEQEILGEKGKLEELEALFFGGENRTTEIYRRLMKRHLREVYYARLSGWCEAHGISLMGHPAASDDVEEEFYFQIPGQDLIMRRVAPETGGIREPDSVQAKLPADIAMYLGRSRNANECFGVCNRGNIPWYFTGYDMKWYINWLGIRGVNLFVPHAFYYSVEGPRKEERPPDVGPHNIWWPYYRLFSEYMKRISWLMTDSASPARVAVLCDNNRVPAEEAAELYEQQIDFHYLPVAMLADSRVREGRLCAGACRFDVVLDLYGYGERDEYAGYLAGVEVVDAAAALYPGKGVREQADGMPQKVCDYRTVETEGSCPDLRVTHREKAGVSWYLFSNEGEGIIETRACIKEQGAGRRLLLIDLWDMSTETLRGCAGGSTENGAGGRAGRDASQLSGAWIPLKLERCQMKLLLLTDAGQEREGLAEMHLPEGLSGERLAEMYQSEGSSRDRAEERRRLAEAFLGDWTERLQPAEEDCCFPAGKEVSSTDKNSCVYRYTCRILKERTLTGAEYFTVRGEEMAECICNGTFAGVSFYGPHKFRIGHLLQRGENEIRLRFTGNAANLYGAAKVPFGPEH